MNNVDWYLSDDGTLDTVIAIECPHCNQTFEIRFNSEFSAACRDPDGVLDMLSFDELVQSQEYECMNCGEYV